MSEPDGQPGCLNPNELLRKPWGKVILQRTVYPLRFFANVQVEVEAAAAEDSLRICKEALRLGLLKLSAAAWDEHRKTWGSSTKVYLGVNEGTMFLEAFPLNPEAAKYNGRLFNDMISLGNGDHSVAMMGLLFGRLEKALGWLGGLQQGDEPTLPPSEENDKTREEGARFVRRVAEDIFVALTGKEVLKTGDPA